MIDILPDSSMICHKFNGKQQITIYSVADVHLGAKECMEQEFMSFIDMVAKTPDVYLILAGDLINNATKSSVSNCFEDRYRPSEQKQMIAKILEPVKDRILCAIPGNHEDRSGKDVDDDPMYDVMAKLNIEHLYRKNMAIMKLKFNRCKSTSTYKNPVYAFAVVHGTGGGALTGAGVNRAERFANSIDGIDVLVTGHTHKPLVTTPSKIRVNLSQETVTEVPFDVVVATSWLKYSGYATKKMLTPTSHVFQKIILSGSKKEIEVSTKHTY